MNESTTLDKSIPITKPFLPPYEEYITFLEQIWERNWLTNDGPLVKELERKLQEYLRVRNLVYVSSGTTALQLAIRALANKGEIITTPFSYVATTSSIVWENCTPVYVDINPETLNIDYHKIEEAITSNTTAILATHVYGIPCDIENIKKIAHHFNLKVIYDAAHCFGTEFQGESVFRQGDISITSFHATKLFQTVEGGAIITEDADIADKIRLMRNFGHDGPDKFKGVGINGKNSELHAAMGLCNLNYIDEITSVRKNQCSVYDALLQGTNLIIPVYHSDYTCTYYPVIFESEMTLLNVFQALKKEGISSRRYFYPSLSLLDYVGEQSTPIADDLSKRVLCLPLYHDLTESDQHFICKIILDNC
jgi:dTDP-4-amino-4,6-dideoxygalactose transaminase